MVLVCGIDEAGRGPVIGPMVLAGAVVADLDEHVLKGIGVKDSKLLTPERREELFDQILKVVKSYKIVIISPHEIDQALNDPHMNLNWLEAVKTADIINGLKVDKVIADCPSSNPPMYTSYIQKLLTKQPEIVCEYKADVNYPVVSAASILAKVTRDREVKKIEQEIGRSIGSGYPGDPLTAMFLRENWQKYPHIFRTTWSSYKDLADAKKQKRLGEF